MTQRRNDYRVWRRGEQPTKANDWWTLVATQPRGNHGANHLAARAARKAWALGWWISPRDALEMAWRVLPLDTPR
jgi:hypothetical protein